MILAKKRGKKGMFFGQEKVKETNPFHPFKRGWFRLNSSVSQAIFPAKIFPVKALWRQAVSVIFVTQTK